MPDPAPTPYEAFLALRAKIGPLGEGDLGYLAKRPFDSTTPRSQPEVPDPLPEDIPFGAKPTSSASIGALESARERIQQVEQALADVIDYLGRLPKHPETSRVRNELTQVLDGTGIPVSRRPLVGESVAGSGAPLLGVELHGLDLYISSMAQLREEEQQLLEVLRRGEHHIRLAAPVSQVLSELEATYAERRAGRTP